MARSHHGWRLRALGPLLELSVWLAHRPCRPETRADRDSRSQLSFGEQQAQLDRSTTVYVGNLSFFTTEESIYELFSKAGSIRRIIMGLDRNQKTPCGFCFVECVKDWPSCSRLRDRDS